jgi:hypothetical protein
LLFEARSSPFRHIIFASLLSEQTADRLLSTLEKISWERKTSSFYRFSVPTRQAVRTELLAYISADTRLIEHRSQFEELFACRLGSNLSIEIHKYCDGDGIGAHTDFGTPEVRFVLNLNRGWKVEDGRVWIIAADSTLRNHPVYLPSLNNTGFAFSSGVDSYHALSRSNGGVTFGVTLRIPRLAATA